MIFYFFKVFFSVKRLVESVKTFIFVAESAASSPLEP